MTTIQETINQQAEKHVTVSSSAESAREQILAQADRDYYTWRALRSAALAATKFEQFVNDVRAMKDQIETTGASPMLDGLDDFAAVARDAILEVVDALLPLTGDGPPPRTGVVVLPPEEG